MSERDILPGNREKNQPARQSRRNIPFVYSKIGPKTRGREGKKLLLTY